MYSLAIPKNGTFVFRAGHFTIKFGARLGHLNRFLALEGGNLNKPVLFSKAEISRSCQRGGGRIVEVSR